jgi:uncharacterized protein YndB with AHSA1/START domain
MPAARTKESEGKIAGIGDAAVKARTGRSWSQWCKVLDAAGAAGWTHKAIAAHLYEELKVPRWWSQMVAVGYEQARGLREKHQTPRGYQASVSRTIAAPLGVLYDAWKDEKARAAWLGRQPLTIRKATPRKYLRITWDVGKTNVEVNFYAKGRGKSQLAVQHSKLSKAADVARMKDCWSRALGKLKERLEG